MPEGELGMGDLLRLPVFPLSTVVFPGQALPLHIFEPRYRLMIARCREAAAAQPEAGRFVVVLSGGPHLFSTGCAVDIARIATEYPDGRLDIVTRGAQRVVIHQVVEHEPYLVADMEVRHDSLEEIVDRALREQVLALATRLTEEICDQPVMLAIPPEESAAYRLAALTGMDLPARQRLLEECSENQRLALVRDALREALSRMAVERARRDQTPYLVN